MLKGGIQWDSELYHFEMHDLAKRRWLHIFLCLRRWNVFAKNKILEVPRLFWVNKKANVKKKFRIKIPYKEDSWDTESYRYESFNAIIDVFRCDHHFLKMYDLAKRRYFIHIA